MDPYDFIFAPFDEVRASFQTDKNPRFVHYTSADVAMRILTQNEVWMRNTSVMNDYDEIKRGAQAVVQFFNFHSESSQPFWSALENRFPGISDEIIDSYSAWSSDLILNTFIMSLSVHCSSEDNHGRLSMWRAYGGQTGVALVLKAYPFLVEEESKVHAFSHPVLYWEEERIKFEFENLVQRFVSNLARVPEEERNDVRFWTEEMFHSFAICLKHPGFKEEREWRIVYRPNNVNSELEKPIKKSVETVQGVPQFVCKIPLKKELNTCIVELLDRIIIGPSQHAWEIKDALLGAMVDAGIENADEKIFVSGIPLRS